MRVRLDKILKAHEADDSEYFLGIRQDGFRLFRMRTAGVEGNADKDVADVLF